MGRSERISAFVFFFTIEQLTICHEYHYVDQFHQKYLLVLVRLLCF